MNQPESQETTPERPAALAGATGYAAYVSEAMDYIIKETRWAGHFPQHCHDRIRKTCEAVKAGDPLPHNDTAQERRANDHE